MKNVTARAKTEYIQTEYGLTKEEADRACAKLREQSRAALKSGDYIPIERLAADVASRRKAKSVRRPRRAA